VSITRPRRGDLVRRVADQRREECGGPEAGMCRTDRGDRVDIDLVVEQNAAAAIDLGVDEARQQPAPLKIDHLVGGAAPRARERCD